MPSGAAGAGIPAKGSRGPTRSREIGDTMEIGIGKATIHTPTFRIWLVALRLKIAFLLFPRDPLWRIVATNILVKNFDDDHIRSCEPCQDALEELYSSLEARNKTSTTDG